jgi:hypothetical protein
MSDTIKLIPKKDIIATVLVKDGSYFKKQENPLKHLSLWDFGILWMAIFFRLLVELSKKNEEVEAKGEGFDWRKYWDFRHVVRWLMHLMASIMIIILLPEIFVDVVQKRFFTELTEWTLFGSGVVGYLGYDMLKVFEAVGLMLLAKINVTMKNENRQTN